MSDKVTQKVNMNELPRIIDTFINSPSIVTLERQIKTVGIDITNKDSIAFKSVM